MCKSLTAPATVKRNLSPKTTLCCLLLSEDQVDRALQIKLAVA